MAFSDGERNRQQGLAGALDLGETVGRCVPNFQHPFEYLLPETRLLIPEDMMATRYPAKVDVQPFDFDGWLQEQFPGPKKDDGDPAVTIEEDDCNLAFKSKVIIQLKAHKDQLGLDLEEFNWLGLQAALFIFATKALALTTQGPQQLQPTVKAIGQDPQQFLKHSSSFDSEAAALVLGDCARHHPDNNCLVLGWELGLLSSSSNQLTSEIAEAAKRVSKQLKNEIKKGQLGGRQKTKLQSDLARELGRLFRSAGGTIKRNVKIGSAGETGPFHVFLTIVLDPLRPIARHARMSLTIDTMVRRAMEDVPATIRYQVPI